MENLREKCIEIIKKELQKNNGKLYIWGCSVTARVVYDYLSNHGLEVAGFVVDDKYYDKGSFLGVQVLKKSQWLNIYIPYDYVVFGFTNEDCLPEIVKSLPGNVKYNYFYFPYSAGSIGKWLDEAFYNEKKADFDKTFEVLADEESKLIMKGFLEGCILGDMSNLNRHRIKGQYFNDLTKNCFWGSFIDIGAYIGDTAQEAIAFYGDRIESIISLEPDADNLQRCKSRLESDKALADKWTIIEKGSWSKETTLHFSSSDSSSSITEEGDLSIEVDAVDHIIDKLDNEMKVGYIKMDVEGSEKETLIGCKETIRKHLPILAICAYHKPNDLVEIPVFFEDIGVKDKYSHFLRYHGPDLRELVWYAIPKK